MIDILMNILIISVIYFQILSYSSGTIHTIINGSLTDPWQVNLTIITKDFKGIILYMIDSYDNQFAIEITMGNSGSRTVNFKSKSAIRNVPLKQICGCDPCESFVNLFVKLQELELQIICNKQRTKTLIFCQRDRCSIEETDETTILMPLEIHNKPQRTYIMIGNIGSYNSTGDKRVNPRLNQIKGCVDSFTYNNISVKFLNDGNTLKSSCKDECKPDSCNGGICEKVSQYILTCNCSNVSLNGAHCNKDLRKYDPTVNNKYKMPSGTNQLYLKLTWKTSYSKTYCLMEIIRGQKNIIISVNGDHLMINAKKSSIVDNDRINFVSIIITNVFLVVKIGNVTSESEFLLNGSTKIHIGLSVNTGRCKEFDGYYDLHYDPPQLENDIVTRHTLTTMSINHNTQPYNNNNGITLIIIVCCCAMFVIFGIVLCAISLCVVIKRREKTPNNQYEQATGDLQIIGNQEATTSDYHHYCGLDYHNMYVTQTRLDEDSDGYAIPRLTQLPPTPVD